MPDFTFLKWVKIYRCAVIFFYLNGLLVQLGEWTSTPAVVCYNFIEVSL